MENGNPAIRNIHCRDGNESTRHEYFHCRNWICTTAESIPSQEMSIYANHNRSGQGIHSLKAVSRQWGMIITAMRNDHCGNGKLKHGNEWYSLRQWKWHDLSGRQSGNGNTAMDNSHCGNEKMEMVMHGMTEHFHCGNWICTTADCIYQSGNEYLRESQPFRIRNSFP